MLSALLGGLLLLQMMLVRPQATQQQQHAHITSRACDTTEDCLDHVQKQWCLSGQLCARHRCYVLDNYPCRVGDFCVEQGHQCLASKPCAEHSDCDDGLFCNGDEQCVKGHCVRLRVERCPGNARCFEQNKSCSEMGGGVQTTGGPTISLSPRPGKTTAPPKKGIKSDGEVGTMTTAPTGAPTAAPTTWAQNPALWTTVLVAAGVIGGVALVFCIVMGAARPATPSSVIVITQREDGTDMDGGQARMMLSRDNYMQRIHYSQQ